MSNIDISDFLNQVENERQDIFSAGDKLRTLSERKQEKINNLSNSITQAKQVLSPDTFSGMYDADSPFYSGIEGHKTGRIGDQYGRYGQAPELKKDYELLPEGINERIRTDNFLMGVGSNTDDANMDPQYYDLYQQYMNQGLVDEAQRGNIRMLGEKDHTGTYGRQILDMERDGQSLNEDLIRRYGEQSVERFASPTVQGQDGTVGGLPISTRDSDGWIGETVDQIQAGMVQGYGDLNVAFRNASRAIAKSMLGVDEETVNKYLPESKDVGTIGFGETKSTELGKKEVASAITGVSKKSLEMQEMLHKEAEMYKDVADEAWNKGEVGSYLKAKVGEIYANVKNTGGMLGDSAAEMSQIMAGIPGIMAVTVTRVDKNMDEYKKNNDGKDMPKDEIALAVALNGLSLTGERLILKTGIGNAAKTVMGNMPLAEGVMKFLGTLGTEYTQERFDYTIEKFLGRDRSKDVNNSAVDTFKEIWKSKEAEMAGIAGMTMAGTLASVPVAVKGTKEALSKVIPKGLDEKAAAKVFGELEKEGGVLSYENLKGVNDVESVVNAAKKSSEAFKKSTKGMLGVKESISYILKVKERIAETDEELAAVQELRMELHNDPKNDYSVVTDLTIEIDNASKKFEEELQKAKKSKIGGGEVDTENVKKIKSDLELVQAQVEEYKKRGIKGSDDFGGLSGDIEQKLQAMNDYLEGKDLQTVSDEFHNTGMKVFNVAGDVVKTKRSLDAWKRNLKEELKGNLKEELMSTAEGAGKAALADKANLDEFGNFMKSREEKLYPKTKDSEVALTLLGAMKKENMDAIQTMNELVAEVEKSTVSEEKKKAYINKMKDDLKKVEDANAEIQRREKVLVNAIEKHGLPKGLQFVRTKDGKEYVGLWDSGKKKTNIVGTVNGDGSVIVDTVDVPKSTKKGTEKSTKKGTEKKPTTTQDYRAGSETQVESTGESVSEYQEAKNVGDKGLSYLQKLKREQERRAQQKAEKVQEETTEEVVVDAAKELDAVIAEVVKMRKADKTDQEAVLEKANKTIEVFDQLLENYKERIGGLKAKKKVLKQRIDAHRAEIERYQGKVKSAKEKKALAGDKKMAVIQQIAKQVVESIKRFIGMVDKHKGEIENYKKAIGDINKQIRDAAINVRDIQRYKREEQKKARSAEKDVRAYEGVYQDQIETLVEHIDAKGMNANDVKKIVANAFLRETFKDEVSMGNEILKNVYMNKSGEMYPFTVKGRLFKKVEDSVFGKVRSFMDTEAKDLIEHLPESFREFFIGTEEDREAFIKDVDVLHNWMDEFTHVNDMDILYDTSATVGSDGIIRGNTREEVEYLNAVNMLLGRKKGKWNPKTRRNEAPTVVVPEQLDQMVKFYAAKMVADAQALANSMKLMDDRELGEVVGIENVDNARKMAMMGYAPISSVKGDIGKAMYRALGVKLDGAPEITEKSLIAGLGLMAQKVAENTHLKRADKVDKKDLHIYVKPVVPVSADKIRSMNKLQYLNENRKRQLPSLRVPKDRESRNIMNTDMQMSDKDNAFINEQEKHRYVISKRLDKWLEMGDEKVLKAFGWVDTKDLKVIEDMHVSEIMKADAVNMKIEREWDLLKMFAKGLRGKEFSLPWGQTVSGRFTLVTDLNYQESKMHREFVRQVDEEGAEVDYEAEKEVIAAAVLQGLDMDPDKLSKETVMEKYEKLMDDKMLSKAVEEYQVWMKGGKEPSNKSLELAFERGGYHGHSAIEAMAAIKEYQENGGKLKIGLKIESDAITSGMVLTLMQLGTAQAMKLAEKGGVYSKDAQKEWDNYIKEWLGDVEFSAGALIEAGNKHIEVLNDPAHKDYDKAKKSTPFMDLYRTVGAEMLKDVEAKKIALKGDKSEDGIRQLRLLDELPELNLKTIRNVAKSPVMVYVYGASINSIKKKLAYSIGIDTIVKMVKKGGEDLQFVIDNYGSNARFVKADGTMLSKKEVAEIGKDKKKLWMQLDVESIVKDVKKDTDATFGKALEEAFRNVFGEVDQLRKLTKSVELMTFKAYEVFLKEAVTKKLIEKYGDAKEGKSYYLTNDDMVDVQNELREAGLGHDAIEYRDGKIENSQPLGKSDVGASGKVTGMGHTKDGKKENDTSGIAVKVEISNTGAAPTITIHAIDGRLQRETLKGEEFVGENVYDATIMKLSRDHLQNTNDKYNREVGKIGFERSIIVDNVAKLENMLAVMPDNKKREFLESMKEGRDAHLKNEMGRLDISMMKTKELLEWYRDTVVPQRTGMAGEKLHVSHTFVSPAKGVDVDAGQAKELGDTTRIDKVLEDVIKYEQDIIAIENAKEEVVKLLKSKPALIRLLEQHEIDLKDC